MLWSILLTAHEALGRPTCWFYDQGFHFTLDAGWTVAIKPDSAGRVRIETCHMGRVRATKWCRDDDMVRLTAIVVEARDEVVTAEV
jgi:hypothetical protein